MSINVEAQESKNTRVNHGCNIFSWVNAGYQFNKMFAKSKNFFGYFTFIEYFRMQSGGVKVRWVHITSNQQVLDNY